MLANLRTLPAFFLQPAHFFRGYARSSLPPLADLPLFELKLVGQLSSGALAVSAIGLVEAASIARSIAGALMAASPAGGVDILMGVGGAPETVIAACAVRAMGGAMLARLSPQSEAEREAVGAARLDAQRIYTANELVASEEIFFAATGITDGPLLQGVRYQGRRAETHSLILRYETHTRRLIHAEHLVE